MVHTSTALSETSSRSSHPSLFRHLTLCLLLAAFMAVLGACSGLSTNTQSANVIETTAASSAVEPITVVVVRHAEKDTVPEGDPQLTATGRQRAEALADLLVEANIEALLSSPYRRTRDTLAPLAERFRLEVEEIPPQDFAALRDAVSKHPGSTVVIAGHSNTVPEIIEALGAGNVAPISEADYDNLYVVTGVGTTKPSVLRLRWTGRGWAGS